MPTTIQSQPEPALHKPKSKIRLRLGLTPPHPKPTSTRGPTNLHVPTASSISPPLLTAPPSAHTDLTISTTSTSTSTSTSARTSTSRPDSRSLFAFDSASPPHLTVQSTSAATENHGLAFDTVSYASTSPASNTFDILSSASARHEYALPTPPPSSMNESTDYDAPSLADWDMTMSDESSDTTDMGVDEPYGPPEGEDRPSLDEYPNLREEIKVSGDVYSISDAQLKQCFKRVKKIGKGNWGEVWLAKPRESTRSSQFLRADGARGGELSASQQAIKTLGMASAAVNGSMAGGLIAMKVVYTRARKDPCAPARLRALWGEMKVISRLRREPHPSIIQFEAFCVTRTKAVIIMPLLYRLIDVNLPLERATPYFRQLASAIGYLHERGITHNDIKPANIMLSYSDVPVLIDFGFAHTWREGMVNRFHGTTSWGTPEYLDPRRALSEPHDERASDIWSLGITFFELLEGRTPFEDAVSDDKDLDLEVRLQMFIERAQRGRWLGTWTIPDDLVHLIQHMLHPRQTRRMTAMQAYHHPSLYPIPPEVVVTPHFIREAAAPAEGWNEPMPLMNKAVSTKYVAVAAAAAAGKVNVDGKKRHKKRVGGGEGKAGTPSMPLGESIKQHTSAPRGVGANKGKNGEGEGGKEGESPRKGSRLVIKKISSDDRVKGKKEIDEEDPTPTKVLKPAQPLTTKYGSAKEKEKTLISRPSQAGLREAARLAPSTTTTRAAITKHDSTQTLRSTHDAQGTSSVRSSAVVIAVGGDKENLAPSDPNRQTLSHRASNLSTLSTVSASTINGSTLSGSERAKNKDAARLKAMQSLEGVREAGAGGVGGKKRDVLANITRPAPEPPRPASLDSAVVQIERRKAEGSERRSLGGERRLEEVEEVKEDSPNRGHHNISGTIAVSSVSTEKSVVEVTIESEVAFNDMSVSAGSPAKICSPQRKRLAKPVVPEFDGEAAGSPARPKQVPRLHAPVSPTRKGVAEDLFKHLSELDLAAFTPTTSAPITSALPIPTTNAQPTSAAVIVPDLHHRKSVEALALDTRLDKISEWVKTVESIVLEARKALAEGRELPLPLLSMPGVGELVAAGLPVEVGLAGQAQTAETGSQSANIATALSATELPLTETREFGVSPDKAIPAHLRTSSTQVEPATPPKWMTYAEAEEKVRQANAWIEGKSGAGSRPASGALLCDSGEVKRISVKKERGSVVNLLKMFHAEKEKEGDGKTATSHEPISHIPLKPSAPTLRATPSTPMLRSDSSLSGPNTIGLGSQTQRIPARKSESNLRAFNFNTIPSHHVSFADLVREQQSAFSDDDDDDDDDNHDGAEGQERLGRGTRSPRRLYERFLDSTPGVVRQGEGWGSLSSGKAGAKPSSMASLREKASLFLQGESVITSSGGGGGGGGQGLAQSTVGTSAGRQIVDLAAKQQKEPSRPSSKQLLRGGDKQEPSAAAPRPGTPGAASVLSFGTGTATVPGTNGGGQKGWGIWKGLKGLGKKGH